MANGDKKPITFKISCFPCLQILEPDTCYAAGVGIAINFFYHFFPDKKDSRIFLRAILHDLGGAELVPPMNNRDFGGKFGEKNRRSEERRVGKDATRLE